MSAHNARTIQFASPTHASYPALTGLEWARVTTQLRLWRKWWLSPHTRFLPLFVIATWRSGSNLLLSYLNQQPNVSVLSEVLCSRLPIGLGNDRSPPRKAIRHIRYHLQGEKTTVRGCKLMLHQLSNCGLSLDDLNREFPAAKFIILYRQALAEQFVSHRVSEATNQYLLRDGDTPREANVHVNPNELMNYCDDMRRRYLDVVNCDWLAAKAVILSYEELVVDPRHWLKERLCPLLHVPFGGAQTRLFKQSKRPLAERISNYREVAALVNSPLCRQQHHLPSQQPNRRAA